MSDRTKDVHEKISRDLRNIGLYLVDHADDLHGHDEELSKRQNHRVAKQENSRRCLESSGSFLVFARNAPRALRAGGSTP